MQGDHSVPGAEVFVGEIMLTTEKQGGDLGERGILTAPALCTPAAAATPTALAVAIWA